MKQFQKKKKISYFLCSKFMIFVLIVGSFFLSRGIFRLWQKYDIGLEKKQLAEEKLHDLENRKDVLINDIEKIQTKTGLEEQLRIRYSLSKENENRIVIIEDEIEEIEIPEEGFMDKTMSWIKKINLLK